jgi:hypothetical protein
VPDATGIFTRHGSTSSSWTAWARADETGSNTSNDTNNVAGTSAGTVLDRATAANNLTTHWAKPGTTEILPGRISTDEAWIDTAIMKAASVDTLQIKGRAVTFPKISIDDNNRNIDDYQWEEIGYLYVPNAQGTSTISINGVYSASGNHGFDVFIRITQDGVSTPLFDGLIGSTNESTFNVRSYSITVFSTSYGPHVYRAAINIKPNGSVYDAGHIIGTFLYSGFWR